MAVHTKNSKHHPQPATSSDHEATLEMVTSRNRAVTRNAGHWPSYHEHSLFYAAAIEVSHEFQVPIEMAMMTALGAISCVCQDMVDVRPPVSG